MNLKAGEVLIFQPFISYELLKFQLPIRTTPHMTKIIGVQISLVNYVIQ